MLVCPALLISGFLTPVVLSAGFPYASLPSIFRLLTLSLLSTLAAVLKTSFLGEKRNLDGGQDLLLANFLIFFDAQALFQSTLLDLRLPDVDWPCASLRVRW